MVRIGLPSRLKTGNGGSQPSSRNASPARQPGSTLVLKTTVLKGRNLAAKDKSGTSDPYLVVTLGDSKESTPSIPKTLNPEWFVSFDLPITGPRTALLEAVCWDKDRIGKDYMGEFDILLEDIFINGQISQEPKWYTLKSKRGDDKKKKNEVSGEIQLQFGLTDNTNPAASESDTFNKFRALVSGSPSENGSDEQDLSQVDGALDEDDDEEEEITDETDDPTKPETAEKRKKRLRIKALKRKTRASAYEFSGGSDCIGMVFLEISKITDLPPERNATRTSFDMDPFVVVSLGRKTFRTRVIRHNLNPIYNEKMVFQVMRHEQQYSLNFAVVDRDKLSGNDFVGTANRAISTFIQDAPEPDQDSGLYPFIQPPEPLATPSTKSRFRLGMSRSASASSLKSLGRPPLTPRASTRGDVTPPRKADTTSSTSTAPSLEVPSGASTPGAPLTHVSTAPTPSSEAPAYPHINRTGTDPSENEDDQSDSPPQTWEDPDMKTYVIPLVLKNKDKWGDRNQTLLYIKAKYLPYPALRQQFWRAMLKQYDADESGRISKIELTTMLDTLGSTLKDSTIDRWFQRWESENGDDAEMSFDQAVISMEEQLQKSMSKSVGETVKGFLQSPEPIKNLLPARFTADSGARGEVSEGTTPGAQAPAGSQEPLGASVEAGDAANMEDLADDRTEEHVIEIRECPICHQPRLNKRSDADIITHIATCASSDWRQVNNLVMAGFVTSSQAQRKWYSKVINKVGYGGYKLGANSANILVQDRITGQINEEKMSVYVRLGIRLLYKGLGSRDMEKRRIRNLLKSLSIKQGKKYDDPASAAQIEGFIQFHQLDMGEVLLPIEKFRNFNEFFYRALKPDARPCSAPENPKIIVSPADCRSVVFNRIDEAMRIWVKGREFSLPHLLGDAYPQDAKRYVGGALGVFRLAPQDYHRFHVPVDGVLNEPKLIAGEYYTVNPMAIRSALDVYGENIRVICPIDSVAHGRVMFICIGAMMVGSTVITRKTGEKVARAEELGYFKFGGSTVLLLFEPGQMVFDGDMVDNSNGALETLVRVGMSIGHSPDTSQHMPDMPKNKENITQAEKEDAIRRIGG